MLKSYGVVVGGGWWVVVVVVVGGGLEQFSVSPRPLGFGFGTKGFGAKGLGPGLDNLFQELLRDLISSGAPIDGIGLQSHIDGNKLICKIWVK